MPTWRAIAARRSPVPRRVDRRRRPRLRRGAKLAGHNSPPCPVRKQRASGMPGAEVEPRRSIERSRKRYPIPDRSRSQSRLRAARLRPRADARNASMTNVPAPSARRHEALADQPLVGHRDGGPRHGQPACKLAARRQTVPWRSRPSRMARAKLPIDFAAEVPATDQADMEGHRYSEAPSPEGKKQIGLADNTGIGSSTRPFDPTLSSRCDRGLSSRNAGTRRFRIRESEMRRAIAQSTAGTGPASRPRAARAKLHQWSLPGAGTTRATQLVVEETSRRAEAHGARRDRNGSLLFTDGPFAETKEVLFSF